MSGQLLKRLLLFWRFRVTEVRRLTTPPYTLLMVLIYIGSPSLQTVHSRFRAFIEVLF